MRIGTVLLLTTALQVIASQVPKREFKLEGKVALVKGDHLTINVGSTYGVRVGDMFCVSKPGQELPDWGRTQFGIGV